MAGPLNIDAKELSIHYRRDMTFPELAAILVDHLGAVREVLGIGEPVNGNVTAALTQDQLDAIASISGFQNALNQLQADFDGLQGGTAGPAGEPGAVGPVGPMGLPGSDAVLSDEQLEAIAAVEGNTEAIADLENRPAGALVRTESNGASILHDGSGSAAPTFIDNGSGSGSLSSNGNNVLSVAGQFSANNNQYALNHDSPGGIAGGSVYLVATGATPGGANGTTSGPTSHQWTNLIGSAAHRFIWSF